MTALRPNTSLRTLQLGMSWLPEQAGNGLDRVFHALMRHLPMAGVQVEGLVAGSAGLGDGDVRSFAPDSAPLLRRFAGLRRAVRETLSARAPDVVAAHFAPYAFPALDLLRRHPLVVHFHGPWAEESRLEGDGALAVRSKGTIERMVYRRAELLVVLSDAFAEILATRYRVDPRRIRIVPGGVDAARFDTGLTRAEARARLGWPPDRPILLSVRRLWRRMGLENLVEAFAAVHRAVPDARLHIAGKGPLAGELQARIRAAGLDDHMRLLGFVPEAELPLAYRAADLSVVPSVALEGFGLVTVESLAAGTPVLVTPIGGLPEAVRDLSPDLVLPDATAPVLADRLTAALRGGLDLPGEAACRRYACERFDWAAIARQMRGVYEEARHG
ncbi:glycosyltransferase family 4 protein [Falsiroseomonas sp.]|uniref:glycosyltransferase family 4 protein n=1 Tax=Falsiroseomonas sp. TaxID=2870721 RepID=UPI003567F244